MYDLGGVLLITILAVLSGAKSYRDIHRFAKAHLRNLRRCFGLSWAAAPSYTGIRTIIRGTSGEALEKAFRAYSGAVAAIIPEGCDYFACDGKVLRGSFDHMEDKRAAELLSIFATGNRLILAHMEIPDKTNEIPAFQELVKELGLTGKLFTLDAMHCQKKRCKQ
jgi:hypothetical protein